jgi:diacylglycerol kinase family enzyme
MSEPSATTAANPRFERALVVANPIAGRGRAEAAARALCAELERHGIAAELFLTRGRGQGGAHVRAEGHRFDVVVSVGGDGTLGEVLTGIGTQNLAVAQLPFGTANVLAKDARLPRTPKSTAALVASGRTTPLDTAVVNGRLSFLCVGIGFDGACVAEVERRRRGPISKLDYVRAGLFVVRHHRPARVRITLDGRAVDREFGFVLISNVREYGAVFRLARDSRRDDGQVEVYGLERASRLDLLRFGARAMLASQPGGPVYFGRGKTVRVDAEPGDAWQLDGDFGGHGSFTYDLSGPVQRLVAP